jgi:hypothetical protein
MMLHKILPVLLIACLITICLYNFSYAGGWDQCKGCHNGNVAPDARELKEKYQLIDKFVEAAGKTDDPLMAAFRNNEKLLREAAKDIGLK